VSGSWQIVSDNFSLAFEFGFLVERQSFEALSDRDWEIIVSWREK